jgi:hypothetical protein
MSRFEAVGAVALATGLCIAGSPAASADKYTDADTKFVASVAGDLVPLVDEQAMDRIIADGHKVCALMDGGQFDVIAPYIAYEYNQAANYGLFVFAPRAAKAYCPWHEQTLIDGAI